MRLALHATGEVGRRAGLILLNGTGLEVLGLIDGDPGPQADQRVERADDLAPFDGVLTDAAEPGAIVDRAIAAGTAVATWVDFDGPQADVTVLGGANLATGITAALAFHEAARSAQVLEEVLAWTEPGQPLRKGSAVAFPEPVGARWGRNLAPGDDAVPTTRIAVPVKGEWAAASALVTSGTSDGVVRRVVGVADLAVHLEAIALAAGGATLDAFPAGACQPVAAAEVYLSKTLEMGLAVATHVDGTPSTL